LPPFAVNILFLLQLEIFLCIKELNTSIKANVETQEVEDIEDNSKDVLDKEDRDS
jgi:hypothetical protein